MTTSIRPILQNALAGALVALSFAATASPASAGPILTITPSATTVNPGENFSVDVEIHDVTDLFGFGIILTIDDLTKATFRGTNSDPCVPDGLGDPCGLGGDPDNDPTNEGPFLLSGVDPTTGDPNQTFYYDQYLAPASLYVSNSVIGSCCGVNGHGVLFTAFFTGGQQPGTVSFAFGTSADVAVGLFDSTIDANGSPGVITPSAVAGTRVDIVAPTSEVPEPATVGLVGMGVAALWRRRRQMRRPTQTGRRRA